MGRTNQKNAGDGTKKRNIRKNNKDKALKKKRSLSGKNVSAKKPASPSKQPAQDAGVRKPRRFSARKSFEDARKTGTVRLPETTVERLFHRELVKALNTYTGKQYTRKEVQLQSGICKYLQSLCNVIGVDIMEGAKVFTMTRGTVTTKQSDIINSLQMLKRHGTYGNLLLPALLAESDNN